MSAIAIISARRPLGKWMVAVRSHSGRLVGTRFWKNALPSMPSGNRSIVEGRSRHPTSAPSATAR